MDARQGGEKKKKSAQGSNTIILCQVKQNWRTKFAKKQDLSSHILPSQLTLGCL